MELASRLDARSLFMGQPSPVLRVRWCDQAVAIETWRGVGNEAPLRGGALCANDRPMLNITRQTALTVLAAPALAAIGAIRPSETFA